MGLQYPIEVHELPRIRGASARIRDGKIVVKVPKRWPKVLKGTIISDLVSQVQQQEERSIQRLQKLIDRLPPETPRITLHTEGELVNFVAQVNHETFNVPYKRVRLGQSKYSRLAQMNIRTRTMTISRYCLNNVPIEALRYLVIHELAHLFEANHSRRFWQLVEGFCPNYRQMSKVIQAFHRLAVIHDDTLEPTIKTPQPINQPISPPKPQKPMGWFEALQLKLGF